MREFSHAASPYATQRDEKLTREIASLTKSRDGIEGVRAFLDKRTPEFTGE